MCTSEVKHGSCLLHLVVKSTLVLPNSILVFNAPLKIKLLKIETLKTGFVEKNTASTSSAHCISCYNIVVQEYEVEKRELSLRDGQALTRGCMHCPD